MRMSCHSHIGVLLREVRNASLLAFRACLHMRMSCHSEIGVLQEAEPWRHDWITVGRLEEVWQSDKAWGKRCQELTRPVKGGGSVAS